MSETTSPQALWCEVIAKAHALGLIRPDPETVTDAALPQQEPKNTTQEETP